MDHLNPFWLIVFTGAISLVPVLLSVGTSMLKISIVLALIRQGLGTQSTPGPMVSMSLSLVLTLVVMGPTFEACFQALPSDFVTRIQNAPSKENIIRLAPAIEPWREFLRTHTSERETEALRQIRNSTELSFAEQILAFMLTELREGFTLGFLLLIPFLVIDLIVSQILVGLGLSMMSPTLISLPLKLLLFITSDAWLLIGRGLVQSYGVIAT